jgi:hypothetical protein
MPGINSAASLAAQSGPLLFVMADANGNLAARPESLLGFATVQQLQKLQSQAFDGIAAAFAMAGTPTLYGDERFGFTLNWGYFEGHNGGAISGAVKIHNHIQFNGAFAMANRESLPGGRVGLRFAW